VVHGLKWPLTILFYLLLNFSLVRLFGFSRGRIIVSSALVLFSAVLWPSQPLVAFGIGTVGFVWTLLQNGEEGVPWLEATSELGLQILPLLLGGVFIAGVLLGRPGEEGIVPSAWIASWVGGNGLFANFFSSVVAALMYFATLTEVPILQGLLGNGMGQGPALALLLAGPALSLPSILVIKSVMGWKRTLVYVGYVVLFSTLAGWVFGFFQG
jgi:hypothetical protein